MTAVAMFVGISIKRYSFLLEDLEAVPADYVPAGHVLISADRYRIADLVIDQGNSLKRLGKDAKGNTIVHPSVSLDEHVAVQKENKVWWGRKVIKEDKEDQCSTAVIRIICGQMKKAYTKVFDMFQKIKSQLNQVQARQDNDDINEVYKEHFLFVGHKSLELDVMKLVIVLFHQFTRKSGRLSTLWNVFCFFCCENEPDKDMIFEDFDQVESFGDGQNWTLSWQMAMLSLED
ncbi:hypothetical protein Tco_0533246 [Tanacetum coccineum]